MKKRHRLAFRILRAVASPAFDRHLTECAYAHIFRDEELTFRKLLKWEPLTPVIDQTVIHEAGTIH